MLTLSIKHYRVFGMSEKAVVLFSAYGDAGIKCPALNLENRIFPRCQACFWYVPSIGRMTVPLYLPVCPCLQNTI